MTATKTSLKKWICAASNFIALISSRLLRQILANLFLSWILEHCMYQSSGNEKEGCCLFFPSSSCNDGKKCTKKRDALAKLLFCLSKPIAFLPFSLRRRCRCLSSLLGSLRNDDGDDYKVKLPNFTFCRGREKKTTTFFFISWTLMQFFKIQLQKNLPTFDELNEVE